MANTHKKAPEVTLKGKIKGDKLIVEIPLNEPKLSKSGKSLTIGGARFAAIQGAEYEGLPVKIAGLTVYVPAPQPEPATA